MKKKIIFRADGNTTTGLGHLYRLFAIVEMVKEDYEYVYLTQSSTTTDVIPESYPLQLIDKAVDLSDEPLWISSQFNPEEYIIIADGYQFKSDYQKSLKKLGFTLIYIDDLEEYHMYADVVVNHSSSAKKADFIAEEYTVFALGTDYSLLRPKFLKAAKTPRLVQHLDTAFVCFGGADKYDFSLKTAKVLLEIDQVKEINIVLGAAYKNNEILELEKLFSSKLRIFRNLSERNLLELMLSCNFAVAPTSTILYELSCVKMPIISGYFVDNQISVYNWYKSQNCFYGVDDFTSFKFDNLKSIFETLNNATVRKTQIENQSKCIDGKQKERFLKLIATFAGELK